MSTAPSPVLRLSWVYVAISIVAGPAVLVGGWGIPRGGSDYCDGVYHLPTGGWDPAREGEYALAQTVQIGLSVLLAAVGLVLLVLLVRRRRALRLSWVPAGAAVVVIMLGYALVGRLAQTTTGQVCGALIGGAP